MILILVQTVLYSIKEGKEFASILSVIVSNMIFIIGTFFLNRKMKSGLVLIGIAVIIDLLFKSYFISAESDLLSLNSLAGFASEIGKCILIIYYAMTVAIEDKTFPARFKIIAFIFGFGFITCYTIAILTPFFGPNIRPTVSLASFIIGLCIFIMWAIIITHAYNPTNMPVQGKQRKRPRKCAVCGEMMPAGTRCGSCHVNWCQSCGEWNNKERDHCYKCNNPLFP